MDFRSYIKKLYINSYSFCNTSWKVTMLFISACYRFLLFKINAFFAYTLYLLSLSCVGFGILKALKPRTESAPRNINLFFTSVSATTVSSMSVVEMEVFSNTQLMFMTVLMFVGGEVFTSVIRLHLKAFKFFKKPEKAESVASDSSSSRYGVDQIELSVVSVPDGPTHQTSDSSLVEYNSIKFLRVVVLLYLVVIQILGIVSVLIYVAFVSSAGNVLRNKGIKAITFAVFSIVSCFSSCGFVPTNESMMVFSRNSGLLWILIPHILLGNTLFPSALRAMIWIVGVKMKWKREEAEYLLETSSGREIGFVHLLGRVQCVGVAATVFGFTLVGLVLFLCMEWNTAGLDELNGYQKVVGIIFQCVNARHAGQTILDLSTIAPPILLFLLLIMYLPPYTAFLPIEKKEEICLKSEEREKKINKVIGNMVFSQLSYLVIFIILICITERKRVREDPLNFSVLNITFEVISAYGNVGFTTGYSCDRQLRGDAKCVNKWYGFSGEWSDQGKILLILVMFWGRMKQFHIKGGRAWMLL